MAEPTRTPKARAQADRRQRIIDTAAEMAEADGWDGVTTRRLSEAISYSQPVLYGHFPGGKAEITTAVALQGFQQIGVAMSVHADGFAEGLQELAEAYLTFAAGHPAVYQAMFSMPVRLAFGSNDSHPEMQRSFRRITTVLERRHVPFDDPETTTEVLWSALHGLAVLTNAGRLRTEARDARITALVLLFSGGKI